MNAIDSLRMELAALEHQRIRDNEYLLNQIKEARDLVREFVAADDVAPVIFKALNAIAHWDKAI